MTVASVGRRPVSFAWTPTLGRLLIAASCQSLWPAAHAAANVDTGIRSKQCYETGSNALIACANSRLPGQDGATGADATPGENDGADGALGFSFQKVCNSGEASGEGNCPANPELGEGRDDWACTMDRRNGIIWEVKTTSGLRSLYNRYTNFSRTYDPVHAYGSASDASGYADEVNRRGLCGANDWGLEHAERVQFLLNYGSRKPDAPRIEPTYFPNSLAEPYWNGSLNPDSESTGWTVDFASGVILNTTDRSEQRPVRLARGKRQLGVPPGSGLFISADGTEVDVVFPGATNTWQRCVVGMRWNGTICDGLPAPFTHEQALRHAAKTAARTGLAWRVPNAKDLAGIADRGVGGIKTGFFPETPDARQWSSTPSVDCSATAWAVDFTDGTSAPVDRAERLFLRLVRP